MATRVFAVASGYCPAVRSEWTLETNLAFLNHGSFGACPRAVLQRQAEIRAQMEAEPVRFFVRELEPMLADARDAVASFLGAEPSNLVFVRNATEGVNAVLRSLNFGPGDEILVTNHGYNAVANCARWVCERSGATLKVATLPFPIADEDSVVDAILASVSQSTALVILDHVTSPTGVVLPVERLVRELTDRGVHALIDGAHGPGMLPLQLEALGAAYYTGNFHKWVCAPKGAAFLWVREDRQPGLVPPVISHGYNSPRDRSRFLELFDWTGTADYSAMLCVPTALRFMERGFGGWDAIRERSRALLRTGRDLLCAALDTPPPVPDSMLGFLAAVPIPNEDLGREPRGPRSALYMDELQLALYERHRVEVPIVPWPAPPKRLVRISAQVYNEQWEYERLVEGLMHELKGSKG